MTTQELVDSRKRLIRNTFKGYDNTLRLHGKTTLTDVLNYIDETPISNEDYTNNAGEIQVIKSKITTIMYQAKLKAKRLGNQRLAHWCDSFTEEIYASALEYERLNWRVFSIESDIVKTFMEKHTHNRGIYENILDYNGNTRLLTLKYDDMLYNIQLSKGIPGSEEAGGIDITTAYNEMDDKTGVTVYSYHSTVLEAYLNNVFDPLAEMEEMKTVCDVRKCPYRKASHHKLTDTNHCEVSDCEKCSAFNDKGQFKSPYKVLEAVDAIMYAMNHRYTPTTVINEGVKPDYQPLPISESDKEVVIYIDDSVKESVVRIVNHDENYIPGTHASPREHERRGYFRRNPKTGLKTVWVKGCIVNKGHTKTSYKVKYANSKECVNE